jgi:hypothetical protein
MRRQAIWLLMNGAGRRMQAGSKAHLEVGNQ